MKFSSMQTDRAKVLGLGSAKSGTSHFWQQRLTGILLVPLVVGFICILLSTLSKDYAGARAIVGNPFSSLVMVLLVGAGIYHMRLGMQTIIEDYVHSEVAKVLAALANNFFAILLGTAAILALLKLSFAA